ncbi:MAG: TetR/AcrR family transcriptional regulator [Caulobacterales bacterium]|nr:TetR/AcrR family transcriptional regulator [Caulobacterales bacterium]
MARQAERREATRTGILLAARRLFATEGFAAASVDRIAAEAGVAKGAVYHHFPTKEAVFAEVLEAVSQEVAAEVARAALGAPDVLAMLTVGSRAYFAATSSPDIHRILLEDGPAVLGWTRWREIDARHFGASLPAILERAMADGLIAPQPTAPMARLLLGAMTEAAMAAAQGQADAADCVDALERLVNGLRR